MKPAMSVRYMLRESRGMQGRILFFVVCLGIGVAAIVCVAGLGAGIEAGIRREARQLLAADLSIRGFREPTSELLEFLDARPGISRTSVKEMVTMIATPGRAGAPGRSQLVELKAVGKEYPFYGELQIEPPSPLGRLLSETSAVGAPGLLARLSLASGDPILIGGKTFTLEGTVKSEPDRLGGAFSLGPRLLISEAGLKRSGLERVGSRILRCTLVKLPEGSRAEAAEELAEELRGIVGNQGIYRIETFADAQPALRRGLRRIERFLALVALLSLLIGGIGVAQTVRAWLAGRMDAIAILRCLGMRPREVVMLYLGQTAALSLIGSLLGVGLGTLILIFIPDLLAGFLPVTGFEAFQPGAILRGLVLGVGVALLFGLEPLLEIRKVPPLRVFQRNLEPPRPTRAWRLATLSCLLGGVWVTASVQGQSLWRGGLFAGGVAVASLGLAIAGTSLIKLIGRFPFRGSAVWLRYGLKSLARPGAPTLSSLVALGLGVLFVVGMSLIERTLSTDLRAELPANAANSFLIDVQPMQWKEVEKLLRAKQATSIYSVPVVSARLAAIDGKPIGELAESMGEGKKSRALTREQRLTYAQELQADNTIVEGALWSLDGIPEVSVELDFARDLGVELGSVLRLDIQGAEIDLTVSSLRTVDWESFGINFFLVVEPGVLESAPQVRLAAANLPAAREQEIQDALAMQFPNISLIRTREVLEKIAAVLSRLGLGVQFLGGFTVVAGLIILTGAVTATSLRRGREIALLRALGSTRRDIIAMFLVEHAILGGIAGVIGSLGGSLLAWTVVTKGFEMSWVAHPKFLLSAILVSVILTSATSIAAGWPALSRSPMEVFRGES